MELRSGLAKWIADMLDFRDSMGFLRRKRENVMRRFDSYCCESHPGASVLTEEIVRGWLASEASRVAVASMRMRTAVTVRLWNLWTRWRTVFPVSVASVIHSLPSNVQRASTDAMHAPSMRTPTTRWLSNTVRFGSASAISLNAWEIE